MKYKKYFSVIAIILLHISCNNASLQKNDLEKANLNGDVKSTTENTYQAIEKFGEVVKGELISNPIIESNYTEKYNLNGYLTETNGAFPSKYFYNDKNQLVQEIRYTSNIKILHIYDNAGLEVECNRFDKDKLVQKGKFIYNSDGYRVETNTYENNGKLSSKTKNIYDGAKLVESKCYNENGSLATINKYKYDNNGNTIEEIIMDSNNKVTNKYNSKYDGDNNLIEWRVYTNDIFGIYKGINRYKYSKFDSNNNWQQKIEYENDIPVRITERTIEYYK